MTLRARVVPRSLLDEPARRRMLELMETCYDGVVAERFFADLDKKHFVIVLRDAAGTLMGFSTLLLLEERLDDELVDVVFSGDTVIDPAHWGSKALQTAFGRFCLERKLAHPRRRLFWLLLSKGFRTYLLAVNYFPQTFPKPGASPPSTLVVFRDRVATTLWGEAYDPQREILHFAEARDRVRAPMSPPPPDAQQHAAVRFFLERNPGAAAGDELVCLVPLSLTDLVFALVRASTKAVSARWRPRRHKAVHA
jgi:hypothetical protein